MGMTKSPCYKDGNDCPDRHVGCRDNCEAWREWQNVHEAELKAIRKKKQGDELVTGFLVEHPKRTREARKRRADERKRR